MIRCQPLARLVGCRPTIANERLKRNRAGQVVLQLKSSYKDGTTPIVMSPLEFM
jgi:Putative transposase